MFHLGGILVLSCLAAIAHGAPRIVGGKDAPDHKYPYQVSLQDGGNHFCSGSILNNRWILTAAHCVKAVPYQRYEIVAGTNYLDKPGEIYKAEMAIHHEKYVDFYNYDIALIRTTTEIIFNDIISPIGIPAKDVTDYSVPALFSGWGVTNANSIVVPNNLQEIELKLVTVEDCQRDLASEIGNRHICTFTKYYEGICFGDSGGPLVAEGVQVGIASFVLPCGVGAPDAYTRVFSYVEWIERTMKFWDEKSQ